MLLSKKTIRTLGWISTSLAFVIVIINTILSGLTYRFSGPHFRNNPFHAVPQLQVTSIVFATFAIVMAFIAFAKPNITFTIVTASIMLISMLFCLTIGIYSVVAGRYGWSNTYLGCKMNYNGVLGNFHNIDSYLQITDQILCSASCPCFLPNGNLFTSNSTVSSSYNSWVKVNNPKGATSFTNCSSKLQDYALSEARRRDPNFDLDGSFDAIKFSDYMSRVENDFNCNGWCSVEYYNPDYNKTVLMSKYLFTDINRGPPTYFGCINQLTPWLSGMLQAFGALHILLSSLQGAIFAFTLCQAYAREKDHEKQIPHHHDDNRQ